MKKIRDRGFALMGIVIACALTAIIIGGGVYAVQKVKVGNLEREMNTLRSQTKETLQDSTLDQKKVEIPKEEKGVVATVQPTASAPKEIQYTNNAYGVSLTFPSGWGTIRESGIEVPLYVKLAKIFRLASTNDSEYFIQIDVAYKRYRNHWTVTDMEHAYLGENDRYVFYYKSIENCAGRPGCDSAPQKYLDIQNEVRNIAKTFKAQNVGLSLADKIEEWSLYKPTRSINVGTGNCDNQDLNFWLTNFNGPTTDRYVQDLNGLKLVWTSNWPKWNNEKFTGFNDDPTAFCGAGGVYPLKAYGDKLLWMGVCSSGMAPAPNEHGYEELRRCEGARQMVEEYFSTGL